MLAVIPILATILAIVFSRSLPYSQINVGELFYQFSYLYLISVSSLIYALYPIKFRNLEKRGFSNLLIENASIKTILYFEIPILIFVTSMLFIPVLTKESDPLLIAVTDTFGYMGEPFKGFEIWATSNVTGKPINVGGDIFGIALFYGLMINLGISVAAGIIWLILITTRK